MAFETIPGIEGKIYVPDTKSDCEKKHNCPDCHACQQCSENRCLVCRSDRSSQVQILDPRAKE